MLKNKRKDLMLKIRESLIFSNESRQSSYLIPRTSIKINFNHLFSYKQAHTVYIYIYTIIL